MPTEQAVALGLLLYLLNLGVSLLGAPAFAFGGRTHRRRRRGSRDHAAPRCDRRRRRRRGPRLRWWREVIYVVVIYGVYSTVRNQFGSAGGPLGQSNGIAYGHALDIIEIEDASACTSSRRSSTGTSTCRPTA